MDAHRTIDFWKLVTIAVVTWVPAIALASEPRLPPATYKYIVIDQDLRDALIEFGRNVGLPVEVSDRVRGRLRGPLPVASAEDFLQRLCASYGLVSYFDGTKLHINSEAEIRTETIGLERVPANDFVRKLAELGIIDSRYPVRAQADARIVSVAGPPAYIALIRQTLASLAAVPRIGGGDETRVRVFRGSSS
jgi:type II secretory pathway component GspD/PulD (secretin)